MNSVNLIEEWRDIEGYEGYYQVSNKGNVKSLSRKREGNGKKGLLKERLLKTTINSNGYPHVKLYKNGKGESCKVHRLVVDAFINTDKCREHINHKDGIKTNNKLSNLERCTPSENINHAYDNKLNDVKVDIPIDKLERLIKSGLTLKELAGIFECSQGTIRNRAREHNMNIDKELPKKHYKIDIEKLKEQLKTKTQIDIAKEIGCSNSLISKYKRKIEKGEI